MKFIPQSIPEVIVVEPKQHGDDRGYFAETYRQNLLDKAIGYKVNFIQDNESKSKKGVLRGMHFQLSPYTQAKLVRVLEGTVLDVAVDIREGSKSFGEHVKVVLSHKNKRQLFVPRGFAHGYLVLSDTATFSYKVDNDYDPASERTLAWNDGNLLIDWGLGESIPLISEKDAKGLTFKNAVYEFNSS